TSATAVNMGTIGGNAIFPGSAYNPQQIGYVTGSVTFSNVLKVTFTVPQYASFSLDSTYWIYTSGLTPDWVFQTGTYNYGTAKGAVTFYGSSYNNGTVPGNGTFTDYSINYGYVQNCYFLASGTNYGSCGSGGGGSSSSSSSGSSSGGMGYPSCDCSLSSMMYPNCGTGDYTSTWQSMYCGGSSSSSSSTGGGNLGTCYGDYMSYMMYGMRMITSNNCTSGMAMFDTNSSTYCTCQ
ncbi:MAG: hypothetical protein EBU49_03970, partial [Proteobacteria bacterium]|nr:hypothetical protein [Pseudomonadota bacterium]